MIALHRPLRRHFALAVIVALAFGLTVVGSGALAADASESAATPVSAGKKKPDKPNKPDKPKPKPKPKPTPTPAPTIPPMPGPWPPGPLAAE